MAKFTATWKNRAEIIAELNRVSPKAGKALADAQLKVAQNLAKTIKPYAPQRTGTYRDSIIGDYLRNQKGKTNLFGSQTSKDPNATGLFASYLWRWLEFGTVKMKAQPHIFPIYRARRKNMLRTLRRAVNDVLAGRK